MRDLVRARDAAVADLRRKRQAVTSMMLRQGRVFPGKRTWGATYKHWLQKQSFERSEHGLVLQEVLLAVRHAEERPERVEAVTIMAEIGDLRRIDSPRQPMGYLGLLPGERSTEESVRRLGITIAKRSCWIKHLIRATVTELAESVQTM